MSITPDEVAISVENLSKDFVLPHEKQSSIKGKLINFRKSGYETQHVLDGISFTVKKGEFFGITGRNGSGKSTLLKLLAGIYSPTSGNVQINGKLTPFIELGVGFNPELSGRENVFLNGALLGFGHKEMEAMYDDIVEFAELERFMDQKLKNYSSGMQVRLAFSIAIRAQSDILLIDEVLAVGDVNFQNKCLAVFEEIKKRGTTVIFVSHDMEAVRRFCDRVILMKKGKIEKTGNAQEVIDEYLELNATTNVNNGSPFGMDAITMKDEGKIAIKSTVVRNESLEEATTILGKKFYVDVELEFKEDTSDYTPGVVLRNQGGIRVTASNTRWIGVKTPLFKKNTKKVFRFEFPNILEHGIYFVSSNVVSEKTKQFYDWSNDAAHFTVTEKPVTGGIVNPDYTIEIVE